jgi:hypothetical protein
MASVTKEKQRFRGNIIDVGVEKLYQYFNHPRNTCDSKTKANNSVPGTVRTTFCQESLVWMRVQILM